MTDLHQLVNAVGLVNLLDHGSGSLVYSEGCAGVTQQDLERLVALVRSKEREAAADEIVRLRVRVAELEAVHEDASGAILQAVEAERERCADLATARSIAWWKRHCASNRGMDITRSAHEDFATLARAIRKGPGV